MAQFFLKDLIQFFTSEVHDHGFADEGIQKGFEATASFLACKDFPFSDDENATARARFNQAFADEVCIGARDRIRIENQFFGESANTGELITNLELAGSNSHADLIGDLLVDGSRGTSADGDAKSHFYTVLLHLVHSLFETVKDFLKMLKTYRPVDLAAAKLSCGKIWRFSNGMRVENGREAQFT